MEEVKLGAWHASAALNFINANYVGLKASHFDTLSLATVFANMYPTRILRMQPTRPLFRPMPVSQRGLPTLSVSH